MDFWIDIGFAVLLRLLKNRRELPKWQSAFIKLYVAIETAFPEWALDAHVTGDSKK